MNLSGMWSYIASLNLASYLPNIRSYYDDLLAESRAGEYNWYSDARKRRDGGRPEAPYIIDNPHWFIHGCKYPGNVLPAVMDPDDYFQWYSDPQQ